MRAPFATKLERGTAGIMLVQGQAPHEADIEMRETSSRPQPSGHPEGPDPVLQNCIKGPGARAGERSLGRAQNDKLLTLGARKTTHTSAMPNLELPR